MVSGRSKGYEQSVTQRRAELKLPFSIDAHNAKETEQSMSHQSRSASLPRTAKEYNLNVSIPQRFDMFHGNNPGVCMSNRSVRLNISQLRMPRSINLDGTPEPDLNTGLLRRPKEY